jgi:hypothetical protein
MTDPRASKPLETPPSQRYVDAARPAGSGGSDADAADGGPSLRRGVAFGGGVALFLAGLIVLFGGVFAFQAGLIVVALFLGRLTAIAVTAGAGTSISPNARRLLSVGLSLAGVAVAQAGLWLWAGIEGGVLGPIDYLGQVYGALVPLQFLLAGGAAWLSSK